MNIELQLHYLHIPRVQNNHPILHFPLESEANIESLGGFNGRNSMVIVPSNYNLTRNDRTSNSILSLPAPFIGAQFTKLTNQFHQ